MKSRLLSINALSKNDFPTILFYSVRCRADDAYSIPAKAAPMTRQSETHSIPASAAPMTVPNREFSGIIKFMSNIRFSVSNIAGA